MNIELKKIDDLNESDVFPLAVRGSFQLPSPRAPPKDARDGARRCGVKSAAVETAVMS